MLANQYGFDAWLKVDYKPDYDRPFSKPLNTLIEGLYYHWLTPGVKHLGWPKITCKL